MSFRLTWLPEAKAEFLALAPSVRPIIQKGIDRVAENPLPQARGGYGKPLGGALSGLFKVKFRKLGIRVVYKLLEADGEMRVVVVSAREDGRVYSLAERRRFRYRL